MPSGGCPPPDWDGLLKINATLLMFGGWAAIVGELRYGVYGFISRLKPWVSPCILYNFATSATTGAPLSRADSLSGPAGEYPFPRDSRLSQGSRRVRSISAAAASNATSAVPTPNPGVPPLLLVVAVSFVVVVAVVRVAAAVGVVVGAVVVLVASMVVCVVVVVLAGSVCARGPQDGEHRQPGRGGFEDDPFGLAIFDDRVGVGGDDDETGLLRAFIDTDEPSVRAWALDQYERYRAAAEVRPLDT